MKFITEFLEKIGCSKLNAFIFGMLIVWSSWLTKELIELKRNDSKILNKATDAAVSLNYKIINLDKILHGDRLPSQELLREVIELRTLRDELAHNKSVESEIVLSSEISPGKAPASTNK